MTNPFAAIDARLSNIELLLLSIKHPEKEVKQLPDRCYLPDACEITGLSESQVYKYTSDGKIPHSKFGKKLVFSRKDLKNWIESKTIDRQAEALNSLTNEAKRKERLCRK